MKEQMQFIRSLCSNLDESVKIYIAASGNIYQDTNLRKTAIKRQITLLRQELLNLERMLDNG